METVVVDAQVMGEFVEHGGPDLGPQVVVVEVEVEVGLAEDGDPVGERPPVVAALGQRDALVEAEEALVVGVLVGGGGFFDDDVEVVDLGEHPLGERVEDPIHHSFELDTMHGRIQPRARVWVPGGSIGAMTQVEAGLVVLLGASLVVAIVAALAETALVRASRVRIQAMAAEGDHRARRLGRLQDRLPRTLNAVLLVALLAQVGAASLAGVLAQRSFGNVGVTVASVALTVVLFIYGEAIPKTYAVRHPEQVGRWLAGPIGVVEWILRPLVGALVWIADLQAPGRGVSTGPTITEQELKLLAHRAAREGEITEDDRRLIERAFRVGDRHANDVMVPRTEIVGVDVAESVERAVVLARGAGHRRLPVFEGDPDRIVGVVHTRDLAATNEERVAALVEPTLFVPESKRVLDLLREMQRERIHMAIVVDEHGGTAGLVTVEDVVEELFGDISADRDPPEIERVEVGWEVDGAVPVEDLADLVGEPDALEGEWNTAAGLVLGHAGRLLETGDEVRVGSSVFTVIAMEGRRIDRLRVVRDEPDPAED